MYIVYIHIYIYICICKENNNSIVFRLYIFFFRKYNVIIQFRDDYIKIIDFIDFNNLMIF